VGTQRHDEPLHRGERHGRLGLEPVHPQQPQSGSIGGRRRQQRRLADARIAGQ
jgi:hypothetical protein